MTDKEWIIANLNDLNQQMRMMRDEVRNFLAEINAEIRNPKIKEPDMTFIPDPTAMDVGDTVYLTKEHFVENYGTFMVGHEFCVQSKHLKYYSGSSGPSLLVKASGHFEIFDVPKRNLSRVQP